MALALIAIAGWLTVALLLWQGRKADSRIERAYENSVQVHRDYGTTMRAEMETREARIHQLEAIADAYRIEGLKNPGSLPGNLAAMDGAPFELPAAYLAFLSGYDDEEGRQEAEAYLRSRLASEPGLQPPALIAELSRG